MYKFLLLAGMLVSLNGNAVNVTFRLNMVGYTGFTTPEVNGTFNAWCGSCNPLTDLDGDGIWETTINLQAGVVEYKYSFDNWWGQENLSSAIGCVNHYDGYSNRTLLVQSDVVLPTVCWGLCTDCLTPDAGTWILSWSDEFDGSALDMETWTRELGNHGWGNNELQNYTSSSNNLQVSNGSLKILALQEASGTSNYTSARIITNNKMEFQYGKIEARMKVPFGQGIWPAFWMLGGNFESLGWPFCGEIDIMEHVNNEPLTNSAMHWHNNVGHTYRSNSIPFAGGEFHVYGAIWNEEAVTFTLDGLPYYSYVFAEHTNATAIFQKPFFFLLNVAVGGNWPGSPNASTPFPAILEVDYIRVFELNTLNVADDSADEDVRIFPVPTKDLLYFNLGRMNTLSQIDIYDMHGRLMHAFTAGTSLFSVDVSSWKTGMYLIKIKSSDSDATFHKVVVQ